MAMIKASGLRHWDRQYLLLSPGMMSLINTNYDYLTTMGISEEDPMVGIIVSVYYLGCAAGAVIGSWFSDLKGRRLAILATLLTSSIGNLIMFFAGLGGMPGAKATMLIGRIVMGMGVGTCTSPSPAVMTRILTVLRWHRRGCPGLYI
jgi:MFS family permease